jgi:alpha-tubulin suppressor-like RCC1 family protein
LIEELTSYNIRQVSASGVARSSACIDSNGKVFTWGNGMDGVLGHESTDSNLLIPTLVDTLEEFKFASIKVGTGHMVGLTEDGKLISWGLNDNGQLGHTASGEEKTSKFYKPSRLKGGDAPA